MRIIGEIDGKVIDLTDILQIRLQPGENYTKAQEMLKKGILFKEVAESFCPECGNYKGENKCKCKESIEIGLADELFYDGRCH